MKSKKQVLADRPEYKTLINAVVNRIGMDSIEDVTSHGADSGFSGFIYYSETHTFAMRYRKLIVKLLEEQADQLGEDVVTMVSNFGVFYDRNARKSTMDNEDKRELYKYLGGGRNEQSAVTNVMAWFALEEVCRMFED
jgi:oligoribonuclease NrnB/cAMP/cGMP phosphodiesterase (DHH superfamily)